MTLYTNFTLITDFPTGESIKELEKGKDTF